MREDATDPTTGPAPEPTTDQTPEPAPDQTMRPTMRPQWTAAAPPQTALNVTVDTAQPDTAEAELPQAGLPQAEAPQVLPGFEALTPAWWDAVAKVHETLLLSDADLETVSAAFGDELRARWAYAKALHQQGYQVPEYLTERAPIAPLWPLPAAPAAAESLSHAA